MAKIIRFLSIALAIVLPILAQAREAGQITDWYIKDFQTTITVNTDSSLLIEEKITADCGNLPDKHGIFRVLPLETKTESKTIKTPVNLISITDFNGQAVKYSETKDNFNHTVGWKIGDPDKNVTGENYYEITYLVKNAVRSGNTDFDELYWNLNGNFWDIETNNFSANIVFPAGITQNNSQVYLYSGSLGQKNNSLASYEWTNDNTLKIASKQTLSPMQGITASITFPRNIVKPYQPGFFDLYGEYFWFLLPLAIFIFAYSIWNKYGKDPRIDKTIVPEFEIPENLKPMELGILNSNNKFENSLITAAVIELAVKRFINIEEVDKKWILGSKDYRFIKLMPDNSQVMTPSEVILFRALFKNSDQVLASSLKKDFYTHISDIKQAARDWLVKQGLIVENSMLLRVVFIAVSIGALIIFGHLIIGILIYSAMVRLAIAIILSIGIIGIFGLLMPKRTPKGAELNWRVKGFKLYMETAEKYRSRFHEKENIFEKFLPYAIVFGITKLWTKKMEEIYGKEYFSTHHPAWYAGNFAAGFNADNFASQMNSVSAGIAANIGTTSGAHGAGGVGGGGGGGGGGGW